jgi:hypothetical protein
MGKKSKSALNALTHRTKMVIERISSSADVSTTVRRKNDLGGNHSFVRHKEKLWWQQRRLYN